MKILAIDSSGMPASCAITQDGVLLAEYTLQFKKTHSQTLLPMIDEISRMTALDKNSLDAIAVAGGPGSFTGLRIGSATAKGIAMALDRPIVNVPTLEGLAYNFCGCSELICPVLDARRTEVFTGIYTFDREKAGESQSGFTVLMDQTPMRADALCGRLNELSGKMDRPVVLLGDGTGAYGELFSQYLHVPYRIAPVNLNAQRASSVAARAEEIFRQGVTETAAQHRPDYLRVSQAERVRDEKLRAETASSQREP